MQTAQEQKMQAQAAQKAELERQHTLRMDKLEKEGTAATATARSLQVLAMKKQTKAPTATQTKAVKGTRGAKTTNVGCASVLAAGAQVQAQTSRCKTWNQQNSATGAAVGSRSLP